MNKEENEKVLQNPAEKSSETTAESMNSQNSIKNSVEKDSPEDPDPPNTFTPFEYTAKPTTPIY